MKTDPTPQNNKSFKEELLEQAKAHETNPQKSFKEELLEQAKAHETNPQKSFSDELREKADTEPPRTLPKWAIIYRKIYMTFWLVGLSIIIFFLLLEFFFHISLNDIIDKVSHSIESNQCNNYQFPSEPLLWTSSYDVLDDSWKNAKIGSFMDMSAWENSDNYKATERIYEKFTMALTCTCPGSNVKKFQFALNGQTGEVSHILAPDPDTPSCELNLLKTFPFKNLLKFEGYLYITYAESKFGSGFSRANSAIPTLEEIEKRYLEEKELLAQKDQQEDAVQETKNTTTIVRGDLDVDVRFPIKNLGEASAIEHPEIDFTSDNLNNLAKSFDCANYIYPAEPSPERPEFNIAKDNPWINIEDDAERDTELKKTDLYKAVELAASELYKAILCKCQAPHNFLMEFTLNGTNGEFEHVFSYDASTCETKVLKSFPFNHVLTFNDALYIEFEQDASDGAFYLYGQPASVQ